MTKENERCCHEKEMLAQLNAEDREMYSELDDDAKDFVYYWYYKDYDCGCNKFHDNFLKLTAAEKNTRFTKRCYIRKELQRTREFGVNRSKSAGMKLTGRCFLTM